MKVTMFKRPQPKQFNLKLRYWNPEEEKKELQRKKYAKKSENYKFNAEEFKEELSYRWALKRQSHSSFNKKYTSLNKMLMFALIATVIICILVYYNEF